MLSTVGLLAAGILWLAAMAGIAWSWNKHAPIVVGAGFEVEGGYQHKGLRDVARRYVSGWTAFFAALFLVMALSDFPLWQRLGIALFLALLYGLSQTSRNEKQWIAKAEPQRTALFGKTRDRFWYRTLAIAEWAGYLCVIVFATDLVGMAI